MPMTRELCSKLKPDVLVMDAACGDGFTLINELPRWSAQTEIVVFTALADALSVQRAFRAGALGYVTRRDPVSALMAAILDAVAGTRRVSPRVEHVLLEKLACGGVEVFSSAEAALSARELQIFRLIGCGSGTRAIAEELRVSVKTIETHRQRIKEKMHFRDGTELHRQAVLFHASINQ